MALLPPTYLVAVVLLFILFRLRHILGVSALLMHRVSYFLRPSNEVLESLNTPPATKKQKNPKPEKTVSERLQSMQLRMTEIQPGSLQHCLFFDLYDILITLSMAGMVLFWIQQGVDDTTPDPSYYVLLMSFILSILFPLHIKFGHGLFASYEAKLGVGVGTLALVIAAFCIYTPPGVFDFDIDGASMSMDYRWNLIFAAVTGNATALEEAKSPIVITRSASLYLGGLLGIIAGIITSTQFLPALRFARMYMDFISSRAISTSWKFVLHLNQFLPLLVAVSYIRPFYVPLLAGAVHCSSSVKDEAFFDAFRPRDCGEGFITESLWRDIRLTLVIVTAATRFICFRSHLQYFLLEPKGIITGMLLQRGRINTEAIVDKIIIPFSYIPVIAVQYLAPCLSLATGALLLQRKSTRCFHWMEWLPLEPQFIQCSSTYTNAPETPPFILTPGTELDKTKLQELIESMHAFPVALPLWYESVIGFLIFWTAISWFAMSVGGIFYWRRVGNSTGQPTEQEEIVNKHIERKQKQKAL
ncbi:hypothetical protein THRCLA_11045 [Thraustotheca clavata]|uniref:Transmembrane protein n=1 Tax=Thraustotheca clavata TaxID=74557 RepID=A0A1V9Y926_9STRA|nr:hypothetical protein THRCLA_11045 [Thraustotheca clavata]